MSEAIGEMEVVNAATARARRQRAQVNKFRVEYVVALREVLGAFCTANGSAAALQAARIVRTALNSALLPKELEEKEEK